MKPLVSVIIPVYNGEDYLKECLDSVVNQTLENIQIICVNDGSTDHSAAILKEYAARDNRFTIITQSNAGQSSARNHGLRYAEGCYLHFMDCDDRLLPEAYQMLVEQADRQELDIIYFDGSTFFDSKELNQQTFEGYRNLYTCKTRINNVLDGKTMFQKLFEAHSYRVSPCMQMLRRAYLEMSGISFYEGVIYEDNIFTLKSMTQAARTGYCHQTFYERRMHEGSTVTSKKNYRHARSYAIVYAELCQYAFANAFSEGVMRGIMVQLNSLRDHANEVLTRLTKKELNEAKANDPCFDLVTRLCRKPETTSTPSIKARLRRLFIPRVVPKNPILRFVALLPLRSYKALRMLFTSGPAALIQKIRSMLRSNNGSYRPSRKLKKYISQKYSVDGQPLVSAILPVFNGEDYLADTIASLRKQTLNNVEFIFVDDGSTDNSVEILNKASRQDPRIKVVLQQNTNAGAARNNGMDHARGEYLIFLDSDDTFDRNLLAWSYDRAVTTNAQVVIFNSDIISHPQMVQSQPAWMQISQKLPDGVFSGKSSPDNLYQMLNPWTKLYKRDYIIGEGFRYQSQFSANDAHFTMMALSCADRIVTLPVSLTHYHVGRTSNIQSRKDRDPLCAYNAFVATRTALEKRGLLQFFERELSRKALESMRRELETLKTAKAREKLYLYLLSEGLKKLCLEHAADEITLVYSRLSKQQKSDDSGSSIT